MSMLSGNHDWNMDGKIDWQDDALFHEEIYKGGGGSYHGGSNGGCAGCLGSVIGVLICFGILALLFGH